MEKFGIGVRDSLSKLVPAAFSAATGTHTSLQNERWQGLKIQGQNLQQTVGNWYFDRPGPTKLIAQP